MKKNLRLIAIIAVLMLLFLGACRILALIPPLFQRPPKPLFLKRYLLLTL